MDSRRIRNFRNSFDRNIVDKQVDKIFQTGKQFVDGVSGARPGKTRNSDFQGITSKSVKKVGRWVSEKVDLFFDEDNDDWNDDNFYDDESDMKTFTRESNSYESTKTHSKRPLEAISLRQPKDLQTTEQKKLPYGKEIKDDNWPDEMDFKVERWQRSSEKENNISRDQLNQKVQSKSRNLPRSRRRRV
ncbi:RNA helicase [Prochlorococcus marinus str. MU1404]|uniref:RNA helicase n=1 Tax=Prochlorococcus marinus TaxID=1219 RepID=UPI001ADA095E|nr:RNA helicase [Prochlorococcus marinus]MBO8230976.1 RNA helicase [Prochlorococcus marinus XMU1404]MBW3074008.1 RNA helicase [Prochlorococcus marinus str. MU1404]MCR8544692.1 RNA helicase [Prochlorococcus marinus CUG1432]